MSKRLLQGLVALLLFLIVGTLCLGWLLALPAREMRHTAKSVASELKAALNFTPLVTVDQTVVFQEQTPVMELVVLKKRLRHELRWSSRQFFSTKELSLGGDFVASVGFNLKERFSVSFDSRTRTVYVVHPAPRILTLEIDRSRIASDPGWWNSITDEDRNTAYNSFLAEARNVAEQNTQLMEDARRQLRDQLEKVLGDHGLRLEFQELGSEPVHIPSLP